MVYSIFNAVEMLYSIFNAVEMAYSIFSAGEMVSSIFNAVEMVYSIFNAGEMVNSISSVGEMAYSIFSVGEMLKWNPTITINNVFMVKLKSIGVSEVEMELYLGKRDNLIWDDNSLLNVLLESYL
jgi:uncharacterized UPF0146 family protein